MDRQDIIARLRENEATLRERGVQHAALFGSCAQGEERPDSDVDIMIEVDPAARIGIMNTSPSRTISLDYMVNQPGPAQARRYQMIPTHPI
jgi:predicted nucleotidyltransferase